MDARAPRGDARRRILAAAWASIVAEGAAAATLVPVACDAGVSRQAVYLFFGGRAGLLGAMMHDHERRSGLGRRLVRAAATRPPEAGLDRAVAVWLAYVADIDRSPPPCTRRP